MLLSFINKPDNSDPRYDIAAHRAAIENLKPLSTCWIPLGRLGGTAPASLHHSPPEGPSANVYTAANHQWHKSQRYQQVNLSQKSVVRWYKLRYSNAMRKMYNYPVLVEYEHGRYIASCPTFPGCVAQAPTYEKALQEVREGISMFIAIHKKKRWALPEAPTPTLTFVKVAVNE